MSQVIFSFFITFKGFYFYFKNHHFNKNNYGAFLVLFLGIVTVLTLFTKVKKSWLFYLTLWIIFVIIEVFSIYEISLKNNSLVNKIKHQQFLTNFITAVFIVLVIGIGQN